MVFTLIQIDSKELSVGRAALSNLLGGVGYFYGQSKIALPKGFTVSFRASADINSIWLSQFSGYFYFCCWQCVSFMLFVVFCI